ncbi:MAG TPA: phospholipase D-like domain-containing protein [Gammaproteobacteria bacterium]|nr:phospholipase D-like domain-containing protein [Gammaproteobacteria bacterium]
MTEPEPAIAPSVPDSHSTGPSRIYIEGDMLFAAMLAAINAARHSIKLESYIFADDEIGREFAAALGARAQAGVQVLMNIDAAGSLFWASHSLERALKAQGIKLRWFHGWSWRQPWRYNQRNHRKILVVDGRVGFLGGFNIHRENSHRIFGDARWRDTHVEVTGELAHALQILFDAFWRRQSRRYPFIMMRNGDALVSNYSRRGRQFLRSLYGAKFATAKQRIWLSTPYFIPDYGTQHGLMRAAQRGVDVRLLVPRKNDVRIAQWAAHAAYEPLLHAGVKIHEYLPRMLHTKTSVIDGEWSTVGSANIDYRSFFVNYEINLVSVQPGFAAELEHQFQADLLQSDQIMPSRWARRALIRRLLEVIGWAVRRWL